MKTAEQIPDTLQWKVNTVGLLKEILNGNQAMGWLKIPIQIFGDILYDVAKRASELNDDQMNALMARLALYEVTDPYSDNYDAEAAKRLINKGILKK